MVSGLGDHNEGCIQVRSQLPWSPLPSAQTHPDPGPSRHIALDPAGLWQRYPIK